MAFSASAASRASFCSAAPRSLTWELWRASSASTRESWALTSSFRGSAAKATRNQSPASRSRPARSARQAVSTLADVVWKCIGRTEPDLVAISVQGAVDFALAPAVVRRINRPLGQCRHSLQGLDRTRLQVQPLLQGRALTLAVACLATEPGRESKSLCGSEILDAQLPDCLQGFAPADPPPGPSRSRHIQTGRSGVFARQRVEPGSRLIPLSHLDREPGLPQPHAFVFRGQAQGFVKGGSETIQGESSPFQGADPLEQGEGIRALGQTAR